MGILKKMAQFVRQLTLREPEGWASQNMVGDAGEPVNDRSVLGLSAAWACMNILVGTQSTLPFMVYRTNAKGEREEHRGHPVYRVLHESPNFDQTDVDFWEFLTASIELKGNAFAEKQFGANGALIGLMPVNPDMMRVARRRDGVIVYGWTDESGKRREGDEHSIFHIRGFGGNPLGGISTIEHARNTFSLAQAANRAAGTTFQNGMRPSGVLTFSEFLTPENRAIAEDKLTSKYLGAMNTGRPLILEGGSTWQALSMNPDDVQLLESRAFSIEEICRFFGVPPFMIGHNDKASGYPQSLEQQILMFVKFSLRRRLRRIERAVRKQLLTPADLAAGVTVEFNLEGLLQGDSSNRSAFYASGLSNGWMTINEVRRRENLPPVSGGDTPRMQMQNVPITEAGKSPSALPKA
jgi:HK97 family phage portal protein